MPGADVCALTLDDIIDYFNIQAQSGKLAL